MFRAILALLVVLWASNPAEIWAKQTEERGADTSAALNQSIISLGPLPAEWARQPKINFEPYQFQPDSYSQSRQGDDAFLGISSGLWVVIFTFCLVLATAVQAWLILRAEALTRASLRISQRQAVRAKIDAVNRVAETKRTLEIAEKNFSIAEKTLQNLEIPHVYPFVLKYSAQSPHITATVKNYGRSPAIMRKLTLRITVAKPLSNGQWQQSFDKSKSFMRPSTLGTNEASQDYEVDGLEGFGAYTDKIDTQDMTLRIGVMIQYGDVFDNNWEKYYWFNWNRKTGRFGPGQYLNQTDEEG